MYDVKVIDDYFPEWLVNIVRLEHKRKDRWFFSSIDNPDYMFWVDYPNDNNWDYKELNNDTN